MKGSRTRGARGPELERWMQELAAAEARPGERGSRRLVWAIALFLLVAVGLYAVRVALESGLEHRTDPSAAGSTPAAAKPER